MQIKPNAEAACWDLLGCGPEVLDRRHDEGLDRCEWEGETAAVFRYRETDIFYQIVDCSGGDGLRLTDVWRDVDDYPYGEDDRP